MTLVQESEDAQMPLTTERVWEVSPEEQNPPLTHWVLERRLGLRGLRALASPKGFQIQMDAVVSKTLRHRRVARVPEPGVSPCGAAGSGNTTEASVRWVLKQAEKKWEAMLQEALPVLELKLKSIKGLHEVQALQLADFAFLEWSQKLHDAWHEQAKPVLERAEAAYLLKTLPAAKACAPDEWKRNVEPPHPLRHHILVARAPAKVLDRALTVRVTLHLFEQKLNGVFWVDPTTEVSLIHPDFLQRQGIETDWLVTRGVVPQKVNFQGEARVAQPVVVSRTLIGGADMGHWQYWMTDTEVFSPPAYRQACCDGVIGLDFLRKFAVEFDPQSPAAVTFWSRSDFSLGREISWKPVRITSPTAWPFRTGDWPWSRWPSALDVSNGRWWFPKGDQPPTQGPNRTGLKLEFQESPHERELRVKSVQPGSSAAALKRMGLKAGLALSQVNGTPVSQLDQWQIDRWLSGSRGQTVILEWPTPSGPRIAPLLINK